GVPAEAALHVGDSPREDVEGALAAGMRAVLLVRDRSSVPGGRADIIGSLAELPALCAYPSSPA
ncbi:MAG: HAD family hydrolase, partial [Solirubrobacteraceae bacterium]